MVYCLLLVSLSALFSTNILVDNAKADWWNSSWNHYRTITLDHTKVDSDLSNFPVLVAIPDATADKCNGGNSIRFLAGSNSGGTENVTEYNYEIEEWIDGSDRIVWVNVTAIYSASDTVFNMYYGNSGASDDQNPTGVWDSDFMMVQHMNDSTTSTIIDSTSNNKDGTKTSVNQPVEISGKISKGQDFDGAGDKVNVGEVLPKTGDYTVSMWYKATSSDTNENLYGQWTNAPYVELFRYDTGRMGAYYFYTSSANNLQVYTDTGLVSDTDWHYVNIMKTSDSTGKIYIDGDSIRLTTSSSGSGRTYGNYNEFIGSLNDGGNDFDGIIDEVRISDIERSAGWVKASYHSMGQTAGFLVFGSEQTESVTTVPTVTTNDATGVEENNATIRGTLTNNGSADTTCYFIWGDETPPTDHNDSQGIVAHGASFSKDCTSLSEGTLYYFYTKASNSEGWDVEGAGGIKSFLTKPDPPTSASASSSDGESSSWINLSWTAGAGADRYYVRYSDTSTPTTRSEGTELCNVTTSFYNSTFSTSGTYYFSIWSYASEVSPALHQWSDTYSSASEYLSIYTWHSESFGGKLTVALAIDVELNDSSWIAGSLDCGDDVQKNFTFYQNGTSTIDITIGINSTNGNYSFVNYTTWSNSGHDQYCANFTVDTWSSESMIEPDYPASSVLKSSFAPGSFVYGIRLWMPKSVTYQDKREDFEVVLYVSEST